MSKPKSYGSGALFHQTTEQLQQRLGDNFNPKANYPNYEGTIEIPAGVVPELVDYLLGATPNARGFITLRLSGWKRNSTRTNKTYLSLDVSEDRRAQQAPPPEAF